MDVLTGNGHPIDESQRAICLFLFALYRHIFANANWSYPPCSINLNGLTRRGRDNDAEECMFYKSCWVSRSHHSPWPLGRFNTNYWCPAQTYAPSQSDRNPTCLGLYNGFRRLVPCFASVGALLNNELRNSQPQTIDRLAYDDTTPLDVRKGNELNALCLLIYICNGAIIYYCAHERSRLAVSSYNIHRLEQEDQTVIGPFHYTTSDEPMTQRTTTAIQQYGQFFCSGTTYRAGGLLFVLIMTHWNGYSGLESIQMSWPIENSDYQSCSRTSVSAVIKVIKKLALHCSWRLQEPITCHSETKCWYWAAPPPSPWKPIVAGYVYSRTKLFKRRRKHLIIFSIRYCDAQGIWARQSND